MARAFDPVGGGSPERGSFGLQPSDRGRDQVVGPVIESQDPRLHVLPESHVPKAHPQDRFWTILIQVYMCR